MAAAREGQERAQELATLYGGPGVYPQQTVTVTYDLQPGIYLTANFGVEEMPQFTFFEVTGQENDAVMSVNFCKNGRRELPLLNEKSEWRPRHECKNSTESEVTARIA
jgi:hypothetical protein